MNRIVRLSLILLSFYWPVLADRADTHGELPAASYFEDKQRGWFWYEVLPEPIKPVKTESKIEPPKPDPQPDMAKVEASVVVPVPDQPEPLSSAWLKHRP